MKYSFFNDYSEGAHPNILKALSNTNYDQEAGYSLDSHCLKAAELIKKACGNAQASVHFVSGGTQANLIVLASMLKSYESIIAVNSAHICVHEAGAIESTGHKVHAVEGIDGKLTLDGIRKVLATHEDEHTAKPKVVFISQSTEIGTIYKKKDLEDISKICKENNLYLYLDGARLASALCSSESDLKLPDISSRVDVFYIGGTKNGALLGESIVINNPELQNEFRYHLKQRGALLAKGRILDIQFEELFKDNLYFEIAKHANKMAEKLTLGIKDLGYNFLTNSTTNQIFPIFPNQLIDKLQTYYGFYIWTKTDESNSAIRLVTSWATKEEFVDEFIADLKGFR